MKKKKKKVNAAILIIGNEILSGRTKDQNVNFICKWWIPTVASLSKK